MLIPRHCIIGAKVPHTIHAHFVIKKPNGNPEVRRISKGIRNSRATLHTEIVSVPTWFAPAAYFAFSCFPPKVTVSDNGSQIMANPGLFTTKRTMATIKKLRFNVKGKSNSSTKALP
jgi:hypothetical protein